MSRIPAFAREHTRQARGAELWIFGTVGAAVLLTAHSVVAMLSAGKFTRETGERFAIGALGMPRISPFLTGIANFYSWMLLVIIPLAILTGYGREE